MALRGAEPAAIDMRLRVLELRTTGLRRAVQDAQDAQRAMPELHEERRALGRRAALLFGFAGLLAPACVALLAWTRRRDG